MWYKSHLLLGRWGSAGLLILVDVMLPVVMVSEEISDAAGRASPGRYRSLLAIVSCWNF